jgi:iron(III) transport system permease protein
MAATAVGARSTSLTLGQRLRPELLTVLCTVLLIMIAFLVLYPICLLIYQSFQVGQFGRPTTFGLANWQTALSQPRVVEALQNTFSLAVTRQALGTVIGVALAWILARTNLPGRNWLEVAFWFALLMPNLPILLGWILLLDGHSGLLITAIRRVFPEFSFDIYSWWGIVVAHLFITLIPLKIFLLTPAFRNMDSSLEEASRTSGAGSFRTLFRIVMPIMTPAILFVTLLGMIRSLQSFEIELVLGGAARIDVYSTMIYRQVLQSPPQYGTASALSSIILGALIPFIVLQQWIVNRRNYTTVSGKYTNRLYDLGPAKWPMFAFFIGLLVFIIVVPSVFMVLATFMKVFPIFDLPDPWTTQHWVQAFREPLLLRALGNTLFIAIGTTVFAVSTYILIAYVSVRTRFRGKRLLDFLTWLPSTVPGIVLSLAFLWMFLSNPILRPLYGTTWILIIALGVSGITLGVQLVKSGLIQLGTELEEASWASGAGWFSTIRRILLPLIAPSVAVVGLQTFQSSVGALSLIALLGSANNKPLSLLQLEYIDTGLFGPASVIGVFIYLLTVVAALLSRVLSMRTGLGRFDRARSGGN